MDALPRGPLTRPYQPGERDDGVYAHLSHDATAVDLDRGLGHAQLQADLLVG